MRGKNVIYIILILIVAFIFRIWNIDKPEGLWNDEYIGWLIASKPLIFDFFDALSKNCHMPIYYLLLKGWMNVFTDNDLSLRILSLICGMFSCVAMYFAGKEFKDEKLGLICMSYAAISSILIYFSQEVRMYQLIFCFSALLLYFTIKIFHKQNILNLTLWGITSLAIIFTHTLGIIFVAFNSIFTLLFFFRKKQEQIKPLLTTIGLFLLLFAPTIPFILKIVKNSYASQFWSYFTPSKILYNLTDYFSPIQLNIINTPSNFIDSIFPNGNLSLGFILFGIIPTLFAIFAIINSFRQKEAELKYLFFPCLAYFLTLVGFSYFNKLVLVTKYSIEIYPTLILLLCFGLSRIKTDFIKKAFFVILFIFPVLFLLVNKNAAPKMHRNEGNKLVADLVVASGLRPTDTIVFTYYDKDKFLKYLPAKFNSRTINKYNFQYYLSQKDYDSRTAVLEGKDIFYKNFAENNKEAFDNAFYYDFIKPMKKGDRLGIIFLKSVSFLTEDKIKKITNDKKEYDKMPLFFLVFSYTKNNSIKLSEEFLEPYYSAEYGDWEIYVFEKQNKTLRRKI